MLAVVEIGPDDVELPCETSGCSCDTLETVTLINSLLLSARAVGTMAVLMLLLFALLTLDAVLFKASNSETIDGVSTDLVVRYYFHSEHPSQIREV